jgi:hypothetical protein
MHHPDTASLGTEQDEDGELRIASRLKMKSKFYALEKRLVEHLLDLIFIPGA